VQGSEGFERRAKFAREELRLFPGGEVAALGELVVVNELGISPHRPKVSGSMKPPRRDE
jgi:hypothetical protein